MARSIHFTKMHGAGNDYIYVKKDSDFLNNFSNNRAARKQPTVGGVIHGSPEE